jgi:hypothetical protein
MEEKKLRFRFGLMEWPKFTSKDRAVFYVFTGDNDLRIGSSFVEADSVDDARAKLYKMVDDCLGRISKVSDLDRAARPTKEQIREELEGLSKVTELKIGKSIKSGKTVNRGEDPEPPKMNSDLLDLYGELDS